jgi:sugar O-acyltransferase (sialic acid O-acetyltransferase NeuD family)
MKRVVIIGAGGHAREVADILRQQTGEELSLPGFVVDDPESHPKSIAGVPVLGGWDWFDRAERSDLFVICAVGLPEVRKRLVERALTKQLRFTNAISPLSCISPEAKLGEGIMIFPFSFISAGSSIADHAIVNAGATVSHQSSVARYGTISPGVNVAGNVSIGEGCFLGVGARVIPGIEIGQWSTIGAGAVVIRDVAERVTVAGVPARMIKNKAKDGR